MYCRGSRKDLLQGTDSIGGGTTAVSLPWWVGGWVDIMVAGKPDLIARLYGKALDDRITCTLELVQGLMVVGRWSVACGG